MKRVLLVAAVLAATTATASAGGFVGLGIGGEAGVSSDSSLAADGRSGRLEVGYSFGRLSVEGLVSRFDLYNTTDYAGYTDTSLGIAATFGVPLSAGFGVYGRGGLQHTTLSVDESASRADRHYNGSGLLFGGGFDYHLPLAATNLALFVDYTITTSSLTIDELPGIEAYQFTTRNWMLGAKLGF
ncbi:MAG TPA: outer membrane beta-barrel protein [Kofleriaceae bacterium]|nr:outer membrane beta-barrel protein [Kofleriaceae bacterium]